MTRQKWKNRYRHTDTNRKTHRYIHRQTRRPRDSLMTKQAHKNMNTNIDVITDVRQQKLRNTQKCILRGVQKKRNTLTFHDFD